MGKVAQKEKYIHTTTVQENNWSVQNQSIKEKIISGPQHYNKWKIEKKQEMSFAKCNKIKIFLIHIQS